MGGRWTCKNGVGYTYANKLCDGLLDCADGSDEEGCIEKTCCDKINIDGLTFLKQSNKFMNGKPFYELEGDGEDVYLYYYHDGKKNRYWLISKYINVLSVFGYSFEELMCPQEMHIRSSLGGNWKWAWAECAHAPKYGDWSEWTECTAQRNGECKSKKIRFCKGGSVGYHAGCPKGQNIETKSCDCDQNKDSFTANLEQNEQKNKEVSGAGKGEWTDWGPWGNCDKTCDQGEQQRTRSCKGGMIGSGNCLANSWKGMGLNNTRKY